MLDYELPEATMASSFRKHNSKWLADDTKQAAYFITRRPGLLYSSLFSTVYSTLMPSELTNADQTFLFI